MPSIRIRRRLLALPGLGVLALHGAHAGRLAEPAGALAGVTAVPEGWAGRKITVFFDPRCTACALLYRRTRPAVREGRLQLQWVAVALLGPDSLLRAARWLAAGGGTDLPGKALDGHLRVDGAGVAAMLPRVQRNTEVLRRLAQGHPVTPTWVVAQPDGGLSVEAGLPVGD